MRTKIEVSTFSVNAYNIYIPIILMQNSFLRIKAGVLYRLVGCVMYCSFSRTSGHYTSYIWDRQQNEWFLTNDDKVHKTKMRYSCNPYAKFTLNIQIKVSKVEYEEVLSLDPFLLLYHKCGKT